MATDFRAGEGARAQWRNLRDARLHRHREAFGRLSTLTAVLDGETASEKAWRRGAEGEAKTARKLERYLRGSGVVALHDLRVPGRRSNIDHVCIGPGGITVIDSKNWAHGDVRRHRGRLRIGGRDMTHLIGAVNRQLEVVREVLAADHLRTVDVKGALCWLNQASLPAIFRFSVDGVRVDGPRRLARQARRPADADPLDVDLAAAILRARLGR